MEKKRLRDLADARLAALEAELESARAAQLALVPRDFAAAATGRLTLHAAMVPARQVGGDLYDMVRLDARHTLFAVADVSGRGHGGSYHGPHPRPDARCGGVWRPRAGHLIRAPSSR